jgi:acyl-CoA thioester hydrolase
MGLPALEADETSSKLTMVAGSDKRDVAATRPDGLAERRQRETRSEARQGTEVERVPTMFDASKVPALFFAPFVSSVMRLEPQWIDYNGHLNVAFYHVMFDQALGEALALVGLAEDYVRERNKSFFTGETHVIYKRELRLDDPVRVRLQLVNFDEKRLHIVEDLCHASEGWVAATCELISLHVDLATRKVTPFPADIAANLAEMRSSHGWLPRPTVIGRAIRMPEPTLAQ